MAKVLTFDRAPQVAQELADKINPNILSTREAQLSLGVLAKLLADGSESLVRYSFVNPQSGYRYRSAGIMDEVHSAFESAAGLVIRQKVDEVVAAELGVKSLFSDDCTCCVIPLESTPSSSWYADRELRAASAKLSPTVILPTFEEVVAISGTDTSSDYERDFFKEVDALASGLVVLGSRAA